MAFELNLNRFETITLFLTEKCNKDCPYCDLTYKLDSEKSGYNGLEYWDIISPFLDKYNDRIGKLSFTGGEPGTLEKKDFDPLVEDIHNLGFKIKVNSNGLFIQKGYFDDYFEDIDTLGIHPFKELPHCFVDELESVASTYKEAFLSGKIVLYVLLTERDVPIFINSLDDLIRKFPKLLINPIPYVGFGNKEIDNKYTLSGRSWCDLYRCTYHHPSITSSFRIICSFFARDFFFAKNGLYKRRSLCKQIPIKGVLNLSRGTIHRCPEMITTTENVPLNKENLTNFFLGNLWKTPDKDPTCTRCTYFPHYLNNFVKNLYERYDNEWR